MTSAMIDLPALTRALEKSWERDTSSCPEEWLPGRPALGQCAVTALLVQDFLGGELLRCTVGEESHYLNRLPSGQEVDLTTGQFTVGAYANRTEPEIRERDYVLSYPATRDRYLRLGERVDGHLGR